MSLFDFFKKKATNTTPEPAPVTDDTPITWENTTDPDDFFEGYQAAVQALTDAGKHAAAETLRANEPALQLAFIERFEAKTRADIANISDLDARTTAVIDAVSTVRRYNRHMSVAVRARLAQAKKNLIGE
ncbi:GTP-binding protein [Leuconostoc sp.]